MHIAIVSPYSMSRTGGVQDHTRELSRALVKLGHDVTLYGPELRGKQERLEGVGTVSLGRAVNVPANGSVAPLGISPSMLVRFDLTLDPADVVHVHEPFLPPGLAALARRPKQTPVVGTFHAAAERFWPYAAFWPVVKLAARRLDVTTAASPEARRLVRRYVNVDPAIVPNGVDVEAFAAARADQWAAGLGRVVLFVGRPERRKGYETVLRAFEMAAEERPDVHLVWVPATTEDLPPGFENDRVHCLGPVSRQRLMELHRAADVVCCASIERESFGIVVLEGLAGGSAVLASDIRGYRYAGGDAPVYLPPGDGAAWGEALGRLLDDEDEREQVASGGPERARAFDWTSVAQSTVEVYQRALSA